MNAAEHAPRLPVETDASRIAINAWFLDRPTTGSGQYLTHLLAGYAAADVEHAFLLCLPAHLAARLPDRPDFSLLPAAIQACANRFEWQIVPTPFDRVHRHLAKLWFEQVGMPRASRHWQAELIHVPYWASPFWTEIPVVVTIHDLIPLFVRGYAGGLLGRWYTRLVSASAHRAALVLTDSYASARDIVKHLHLPPRAVQAIYLAADERFHPAGAAAQCAVRHKYGLPEDYLLYLGGFDVRKNVSGILRAFAALDRPGIALVLAGKLPLADSAFFPDPRRLARDLGIADRVQTIGWVDEEDKPALYSAAAAFAFPSFYEGFGLPPVEAMACGTPVIVSDRGSLPEIVAGGGLWVDPEDTAALTAAMRQLLDNSPLRASLSRAGRLRAQSFSWQQCTGETLAAYRHILRQ